METETQYPVEKVTIPGIVPRNPDRRFMAMFKHPKTPYYSYALPLKSMYFNTLEDAIDNIKFLQKLDIKYRQTCKYKIAELAL